MMRKMMKKTSTKGQNTLRFHRMQNKKLLKKLDGNYRGIATQGT